MGKPWENPQENGDFPSGQLSHQYFPSVNFHINESTTENHNVSWEMLLLVGSIDGL